MAEDVSRSFTHPFFCSECEQSFPSLSELAEHQRDEGHQAKKFSSFKEELEYAAAKRRERFKAPVPTGQEFDVVAYSEVVDCFREFSDWVPESVADETKLPIEFVWRVFEDIKPQIVAQLQQELEQSSPSGHEASIIQARLTELASDGEK